MLQQSPMKRMQHKRKESTDMSPLRWRQKTISGTESESEVSQSCPSLCDPMDCNLPGSSLHGILQARVLEWVAISFSRGSSQPRDQTWVSRIPGRHFNLRANRYRVATKTGTGNHLNPAPDWWCTPKAEWGEDSLECFGAWVILPADPTINERRKKVFTS